MMLSPDVPAGHKVVRDDLHRSLNLRAFRLSAFKRVVLDCVVAKHYFYGASVFLHVNMSWRVFIAGVNVYPIALDVDNRRHSIT